MTEFLQPKLTREDVEQVMRWYSSPLGTRTRELDLKTDSNLDTSAVMQSDLAKIVGPERLKRIERIVAAIGEAEAVLLWLKHAGTSIVKIRYLLWGIDLPVNLTDRSTELKPQAERMIILARSGTLRELTTAELDLYVAFAESPAARRWYPAMWGAVGLVLEKGAEEVLAEMAKSLEYHTTPRKPAAPPSHLDK